MDKTPPFPVAVEKFRAFLRQLGILYSIRWVWRDFIFTRRRAGSRQSWARPIFVNGTRSADVQDVERYYCWGAERGSGVALCVLCVAGDQPCCYVYILEDATDASYRMMAALKFQSPIPTPLACIIQTTVGRAFVRLAVGRADDQWIRDLPTIAETRR